MITPLSGLASNTLGLTNLSMALGGDHLGKSLAEIFCPFELASLSWQRTSLPSIEMRLLAFIESLDNVLPSCQHVTTGLRPLLIKVTVVCITPREQIAATGNVEPQLPADVERVTRVRTTLY